MIRIFSRRALIGLVLAAMCAAIVPGRIAVAADAQNAPKKPLVVYFSHSGNTRQIADFIHKRVGGDLVEIKPVVPYPDNYQKLVDQAKEEQQKGARPKVEPAAIDLAEYDAIFLGFPNWWSSMPMPVYTFVEGNKFDGKTVIPFMTHGGGGLGHSIEDLKRIAPNSRVLKPFSVSGSKASSAEKDVIKWLEGLGPALIMTTTGNPQIYPDGGY